MEWNEVSPDQDDWIKQINVTAYYGNVIVGSLVYCGEESGWYSVIEGSLDYLPEADTEEQAKEEMIDKLCSHFESEINYYRELTDSLEELKIRI